MANKDVYKCSADVTFIVCLSGASLCTLIFIFRAFLVCSSTQKCSSTEIFAVLLSKMCSWQMDNISLRNSVAYIFSFEINIPANSNLSYNKQIMNRFGVLVLFILCLTHPVDAS